MLLKILKEFKPDFIAVCFDSPHPTFRHKEFPEYKANRKETDEALKSQFPLTRRIVEAMGLASFEKEGYEADDLIATLAKIAGKEKLEVVIVSSDKDALQLVGPNISVLNEPKNILYDGKAVEEHFGVVPERVVDVLALAGDASDNVPGVAGIGGKTAVKLVREHGTVEKILAAASDIAGRIPGKLGERLRDGRGSAHLSKRLVTLCDTAPIEVRWKELVSAPPEPLRLLPVLKEFEFTTLIPAIFPSSMKPQGNYSAVCTEEELRSLISGLQKSSRFALDTETTGVHPMFCRMVGISFSMKPHEAWYIPLDKPLPRARVFEALRPILENPRLEKIGQNIKFDFIVFKNAGIHLRGVSFDTMVASYLLSPGRLQHGLDEIALEYLSERMTPIQDLIGKGSRQITMDEVSVEQVRDYACADADVTFRVHEKMAPLLKERDLGSLFQEVEMPLVEVLAQMEIFGVRVDKIALSSLSHDFSQRLAAVEKEIHVLAGGPLNLNSPKQLQEVLFGKLGLPSARRIKTGFSTDEEVLQGLAKRHPIAEKIVQFRELSKLKSTYIDALSESADPKTSRVHASFNQAVTATGRLSSSEPNLQNIPVRTELGRKIRRAFCPEPGYLFLSADYSQIDLRVMAHVSQDPALVSAFKKGGDIHTRTAAEVFGVSEENVTGEMRKKAKAVNFGILYGQKAPGLAQSLGMETEEAQEIIDHYFERYSGVHAWLEKTIREARRKGYVTTLLHRRRLLPDIHSPNYQKRSFSERVAVNTPIQGTSADIIKVAMIEIHRFLAAQNFPARMLIQVHDDLLFEVPEGLAEEMSREFRKRMEGAIALSIPIVVDIKIGKNWADVE